MQDERSRHLQSILSTNWRDPFLDSAPATAFGAGILGALLAVAQATSIVPLLLFPFVAAGFVSGYGLVVLYAAIIRWLASKHHWRLTVRRTALSLITVGPIMAIVLVALLLTH